MKNKNQEMESHTLVISSINSRQTKEKNGVSTQQWLDIEKMFC